MTAYKRLSALILYCLMLTGTYASNFHDSENKLFSVRLTYNDLRTLAEKGNSEAQLQLGIILSAPCKCFVGYPNDKIEGLTWLRKAAESGDSDARIVLANHLMGGSDDQVQEALELYRLAALQYNNKACFDSRFPLKPHYLRIVSPRYVNTDLGGMIDLMQAMVNQHGQQQPFIEEGSIFQLLGRVIENQVITWQNYWEAERTVLACLQDLKKPAPGLMVDCLERHADGWLVKKNFVSGTWAFDDGQFFSLGQHNVQLHHRVLEARTLLKTLQEYRRALNDAYRKNFQACMVIQVAQVMALPEEEREAGKQRLINLQHQYQTAWLPIQDRLSTLDQLPNKFEECLTKTLPFRNFVFIETFYHLRDMSVLDALEKPVMSDKDFKEKKSNAEKGSMHAQHELATLYLRYDPNDRDGLSLLQKAAEKKHLPSLVQLYRHYLGKADFQKALNYYNEILTWHPYCEELPSLSQNCAALLADTSLAQDPRVKILSAYLYMLPFSTLQNEQKERFLEAREAKYAPALLALARYYHGLAAETKSIRGKRDAEERAYAMTVAASVEKLPAGLNLQGICLLKGQGVTRDLVKAHECFVRSADMGYAAAHLNLARLYRNNQNSLFYDVSKAVYHYNKSGMLVGHMELGDLLSGDAGRGWKDIPQAFRHYTHASVLGLPAAQYKLALQLQKANKLVHALTWTRKAAEQGHVPAMRFLAHALLKGDPRKSNAPEAFELMCRGALAGDDRLQSELRPFFKLVTKDVPIRGNYRGHSSFFEEISNPWLQELTQYDPFNSIVPGSYLHMVFLTLQDWPNWVQTWSLQKAYFTSQSKKVDEGLWKPGYSVNCVSLNSTEFAGKFIDAHGFAKFHITWSSVGNQLYFGKAAHQALTDLAMLLCGAQDGQKLWSTIGAALTQASNQILQQMAFTTKITTAQMLLYEQEITEFKMTLTHQQELYEQLPTWVKVFLKNTLAERNAIFMKEYAFLAEKK